MDYGYDHLMEISHPASSKYGQHWTSDQVHDNFAPYQSSVQEVKSWLRQAAGIHEDEINERNGWLAVDMPARKAERLFKAEYFEHGSSQGNVRVGCDRYCISLSFYTNADRC